MKQHNYLNFPIYKQTGLPSGSTFLLDAFNQLHSTIWFYCFIILGILSILFLNIYLQQKRQLDNFTSLYQNNKLKTQPLNYVNPYIVYDNWLIELIILIVPCTIVILICLPSTALSYSTGEIHTASASIKITGEQWAWFNDVTIPVTKQYGYQKELFNQITIFIKQLNSTNYYNKVETFNFNYYLFYTLKRNYLYFAVLKNNLYDPNINHLIWINLKFLQTKLPLADNIIVTKKILTGIKSKYLLQAGSVFPNSGSLINNFVNTDLNKLDLLTKLVVNKPELQFNNFVPLNKTLSVEEKITPKVAKVVPLTIKAGPKLTIVEEQFRQWIIEIQKDTPSNLSISNNKTTDSSQSNTRFIEKASLLSTAETLKEPLLLLKPQPSNHHVNLPLETSSFQPVDTLPGNTSYSLESEEAAYYHHQSIGESSLALEDSEMACFNRQLGSNQITQTVLIKIHDKELNSQNTPCPKISNSINRFKETSLNLQSRYTEEFWTNWAEQNLKSFLTKYAKSYLQNLEPAYRMEYAAMYLRSLQHFKHNSNLFDNIFFQYPHVNPVLCPTISKFTALVLQEIEIELPMEPQLFKTALASKIAQDIITEFSTMMSGLLVKVELADTLLSVSKIESFPMPCKKDVLVEFSNLMAQEIKNEFTNKIIQNFVIECSNKAVINQNTLKSLSPYISNPNFGYIDLKTKEVLADLQEEYTQSSKLLITEKTSRKVYLNLPLTNIATPIPAMVWTKLTVDSLDVIHSFWIWDYGVKLDCIPGNPLQTYIFPKKFGISTGNCAEYCGNGHINMPIIVKSYDLTEPIKKPSNDLPYKIHNHETNHTKDIFLA